MSNYYNKICEEFRVYLANTLQYSCMQDARIYAIIGGITIEPEEDETSPVIDISATNDVNVLENTIYATIDALFDDNEQTFPFGEKQNFIIINSYADSCETIEQYNENNEEKFILRKEYFFTRGEYYDSVKKINEGSYLSIYYNNYSNIIQLVEEYQLLYNEFIPPEPEVDENGDPIIEYDENGDPIPPPTKQNYFWDKYFIAFKSIFDTLKPDYSEIIADFEKYYNEIYAYKNLYYNIVNQISIAEVFTSSVEKESTENSKYLEQIFKDISLDGFKMYNTEIATIYESFLLALDIKQKNFSNVDDYYNINFRKIFNSIIYEKADFFEKSNNFLKWIKEFRKKYNV